MGKGPKPAASEKTPNRKSAAVNAKKQVNESPTKENPPNPASTSATSATPTSSTRYPLEEMTAVANNVKDMAKKMLEMQGKHCLWAVAISQIQLDSPGT